VNAHPGAAPPGSPSCGRCQTRTTADGSERCPRCEARSGKPLPGWFRESRVPGGGFRFPATRGAPPHDAAVIRRAGRRRAAPGPFLRELVGLAATSLPVPAHCSVTLTAEDHSHTTAASDELVERFDQRQYEAGEGPCLRTLRTGVPHRIDDVDHEDRFGTFPDLAREIGMRSMLVLPLSPPRRQVAGVMNLYSTDARSFTEPVREQAVVLAGHASGALGVALKFAGQLQFSMDLQRAIVSRAVIDPRRDHGRSPLHRRRGLRAPRPRLPAPEHEAARPRRRVRHRCHGRASFPAPPGHRAGHRWAARTRRRFAPRATGSRGAPLSGLATIHEPSSG
jgi:hypothetical protein